MEFFTFKGDLFKAFYAMFLATDECGKGFRVVGFLDFGELLGEGFETTLRLHRVRFILYLPSLRGARGFTHQVTR